MPDFILEGEYIPMISLLKTLNLVQSGGEARMVVSEGLVKCNGDVDFRKRLKVKRGDTVEFNGIQINIK